MDDLFHSPELETVDLRIYSYYYLKEDPKKAYPECLEVIVESFGNSDNSKMKMLIFTNTCGSIQFDSFEEDDTIEKIKISLDLLEMYLASKAHDMCLILNENLERFITEEVTSAYKYLKIIFKE